MKEFLMGLGAIAVILMSVPTQLIILALYGSGVLVVGSCIVLAFVAGAAGSYVVYSVYAFNDWRKHRKGVRV